MSDRKQYKIEKRPVSVIIHMTQLRKSCIFTGRYV